MNFILFLFLIAVVIPRTIGYVALDDVKILNGTCPSSRVCDFEDSSICGYQNDATADFTWSRHRVLLHQHQPVLQMVCFKQNNFFYSLFLFSLDHTYGTGIGYYMYIETSAPQKLGDKARLITPEYNVAAGGSCLQFFYHMWGSSTGAFNVYLKTRQRYSK